MSGLDTIVQQIMEDCDAKCHLIIKEAEETANEIIAAADSEINKSKTEADRKNDVLKKNRAMTAKTSSDLKKRQAILSAKQEMINSVLEQAEKEILEKNDKEYFEYILKILDKSVQPKDGEIYFSEKDLKRLPKDFYKEIAKVCDKKNASLTIAKEPKNIDGGFILVYGGIEENCSISAMFRNDREKLVDIVSASLFK